MNKKVLLLSIVAIVISFAGGFLLANALNRKELAALQLEVGRLKSSPQPDEDGKSSQTLSDEEIRQKITEADSNPDNIDFQKGLAMALYQYASMKQEPKWLSEVARLLNRVYEKNPKDYNTIVSLGNIYLDISQNASNNNTGETSNESNKNAVKAREFYTKALEIKPNDTDIRTDLGLTYLSENPTQSEKAIVEFQKSIKANPKDEKALENITRATINSNKIKEAEDFLSKLKQVNADNESVKELEKQIAEKKNGK